MPKQLPESDAPSSFPKNGYLQQYLTGVGDGIALLLAFCIAMSAGTAESHTVIKMGVILATLITAIFGAGSYLATKSTQKDLTKKTPEEEKMYLDAALHKKVNLFKQLDLGEDFQNSVADTITQDEQEWKSYLEHQQVPMQKPEPGQLFKTTFASAMAFASGAGIALLPWAITITTKDAFMVAIYICLPLLFISGLLKSKSNREPIWWGGFRQLLLGATLALMGYLIALIFESI